MPRCTHTADALRTGRPTGVSSYTRRQLATMVRKAASSTRSRRPKNSPADSVRTAVLQHPRIHEPVVRALVPDAGLGDGADIGVLSYSSDQFAARTVEAPFAHIDGETET